MAETHVCKATDRPVWVLNIHTDKSGAWINHLDELRDWLKAHDLDANDVTSAAVVRRADDSRQLHARRYLGTSCDEHSGHRYVDWTTNDAGSELVVMPLRADPPDIPGTEATA